MFLTPDNQLFEIANDQSLSYVTPAVPYLKRSLGP